MIRSMFSAVSGLRNHQTMMDVVGNNIANVNTTGFKTSNVVFQDVLSQTLQGGGAATAQQGGTNPAQVGLGARVAAITTNFGQGALQRTGRATDLAIEGDGFFVVSQAGQQLYTRAGSFSVDALGRLVTQDGAFINGWQSGADGRVNTNGPVGMIQIPVGDLIAPVATSSREPGVTVGGNLPANADVGRIITNSVQVFDGQGNPVSLKMAFEKTDENEWEVTFSYVDENGDDVELNTETLAFDPDTGELETPADYGIVIDDADGIFGGDITITLGEEGGPNRLTQYGELSTLAILDQAGSAAGSLQSFTVSQDGLIVGSYSNGRTRPIGQIALAVFANPEGLEKVGGSNFRPTMNSGLAQLGRAGEGGRGLLSSGTLEMSNVDLAQEFTSLIVAQRGFQANSRVVTTSDELLMEVVNLKR